MVTVYCVAVVIMKFIFGDSLLCTGQQCCHKQSFAQVGDS